VTAYKERGSEDRHETSIADERRLLAADDTSLLRVVTIRRWPVSSVRSFLDWCAGCAIKRRSSAARFSIAAVCGAARPTRPMPHRTGERTGMAAKKQVFARALSASTAARQRVGQRKRAGDARRHACRARTQAPCARAPSSSGRRARTGATPIENPRVRHCAAVGIGSISQAGRVAQARRDKRE